MTCLSVQGALALGHSQTGKLQRLKHSSLLHNIAVLSQSLHTPSLVL